MMLVGFLAYVFFGVHVSQRQHRTLEDQMNTFQRVPSCNHAAESRNVCLCVFVAANAVVPERLATCWRMVVSTITRWRRAGGASVGTSADGASTLPDSGGAAHAAAAAAAGGPAASPGASRTLRAPRVGSGKVAMTSSGTSCNV